MFPAQSAYTVYQTDNKNPCNDENCMKIKQGISKYIKLSENGEYCVESDVLFTTELNKNTLAFTKFKLTMTILALFFCIFVKKHNNLIILALSLSIFETSQLILKLHGLHNIYTLSLALRNSGWLLIWWMVFEEITKWSVVLSFSFGFCTVQDSLFFGVLSSAILGFMHSLVPKQQRDFLQNNKVCRLAMWSFGLYLLAFGVSGREWILDAWCMINQGILWILYSAQAKYSLVNLL